MLTDHQKDQDIKNLLKSGILNDKNQGDDPGPSLKDHEDPKHLFKRMLKNRSTCKLLLWEEILSDAYDPFTSEPCA